jgi:hypothetical protein
VDVRLMEKNINAAELVFCNVTALRLCYKPTLADLVLHTSLLRRPHNLCSAFSFKFYHVVTRRLAINATKRSIMKQHDFASFYRNTQFNENIYLRSEMVAQPIQDY